MPFWRPVIPDLMKHESGTRTSKVKNIVYTVLIALRRVLREAYRKKFDNLSESAQGEHQPLFDQSQS